MQSNCITVKTKLTQSMSISFTSIWCLRAQNHGTFEIWRWSKCRDHNSAQSISDAVYEFIERIDAETTCNAYVRAFAEAFRSFAIDICYATHSSLQQILYITACFTYKWWSLRTIQLSCHCSASITTYSKWFACILTTRSSMLDKMGSKHHVKNVAWILAGNRAYNCHVRMHRGPRAEDNVLRPTNLDLLFISASKERIFFLLLFHTSITSNRPLLNIFAGVLFCFFCLVLGVCVGLDAYEITFMRDQNKMEKKYYSLASNEMVYDNRLRQICFSFRKKNNCVCLSSRVHHNRYLHNVIAFVSEHWASNVEHRRKRCIKSTNRRNNYRLFDLSFSLSLCLSYWAKWIVSSHRCTVSIQFRLCHWLHPIHFFFSVSSRLSLIPYYFSFHIVSVIRWKRSLN